MEEINDSPAQQLEERCILCLRTEEHLSALDIILTKEHVFPRSWYPETTPENVQRWTIPSCKECNQSYGRLEEDLLARFMLSLGPDHPASKGIYEKVIRSMDPKFAKDERDRIYRQRKQDRIWSQTIGLEQPSPEGLLSNFGAQAELEYPKYRGIYIPKLDLERFVRKIVRCVIFQLDRRYVEEEMKIDVYHPVEGIDLEIRDLVYEKGDIYSFGPGLTMARWSVSVQDDAVSMYAFEIWEKWRPFATTGSVKAWR